MRYSLPELDDAERARLVRLGLDPDSREEEALVSELGGLIVPELASHPQPGRS